VRAFPIFLIACASTEAPRASVITRLIAPQGLLDRVVTLQVEIVEKTDAVSCDANKGLVNGFEDSTPRLAKTDLVRGSCAGTGTFCGSIEIESGDKPRLFVATGRDEGGAPFMRACAVQTIAKPTETVTLTLVRALAKATCGNKSIEFSETCDAAQDSVCDAMCQTKELYISNGSDETGTNDTNIKGRSAVTWGTGTSYAGRLFAAFEDDLSANREIAMRVLSETLSDDAFSGVLGKTSFLLPNDPAVFPPKPAVGNQRAPALAQSGDMLFVMFEDDALGQGSDIRLRPVDTTLRTTQVAPIFVAGGAGDQVEPVGSTGANGKVLIAYRDVATARVLARVLVPPGALGPEQELGAGNGPVSLAPLPSGWVATWEDNGDVRLRIVDPNGTPQGGALTVNDIGDGVQSAPKVAALTDGRYAVAFNDARTVADPNVLVQRFTAAGRKVAGDQMAPIHPSVTGTQNSAMIAALPAAGGSYVVGYVDGGKNVLARYLGGNSGYLLSPTDGTEEPFAISRDASKERKELSIAVGGSPSAIAFSWTELSSSARIMLRRIPMPTR
jgi:hypothetical protein